MVLAMSGPDLKRVVLAGGSAAFRAGLGARLATDDLLVEGEAATAAETIALVRELRPDVAVVDVHLPDANGIAVCRLLGREDPDVAVVIVSVFDWDVYLAAAKGAGAAGFLLHSTSLPELVRLIRQAGQGSLFTPEQEQRVLTWNREVGRRLALLQPRERDVLRQVAQGKTNRQIADELHVSPHTVEKHVGSLLRKLDVSSRTALLAFILTHHLQALDDGGWQRRGQQEWWISAIDAALLSDNLSAGGDK
jgi:two-component system, NarL family, response regulator DevR